MSRASVGRRGVPAAAGFRRCMQATLRYVARRFGAPPALALRHAGGDSGDCMDSMRCGFEIPYPRYKCNGRAPWRTGRDHDLSRKNTRCDR